MHAHEPTGRTLSPDLCRPTDATRPGGSFEHGLEAQRSVGPDAQNQAVSARRSVHTSVAGPLDDTLTTTDFPYTLAAGVL